MDSVRKLFKGNKYKKSLLNDNDDNEYERLIKENLIYKNQIIDLQLELKQKEETIQLIETVNKELMKK